MQHKLHIFTSHNGKNAVLTAILALLACFSFTAGSGTAHANSQILVIRRIVPLNVDCALLSPKVLKKAQTAGLCTKSGPDNIVSGKSGPDNTVSGNCGSASLFITDNFNGGYPTITIGAASSAGYMISISWHVKWVNHTTGGQNGYGGSQGYFGDNWSRSDNPRTGVGDVYAVMDQLTVNTAYGYTCSGLQPSAYAYVG